MIILPTSVFCIFSLFYHSSYFFKRYYIFLHRDLFFCKTIFHFSTPFWNFSYFVFSFEKFKSNHIDPIPCKINLGDVLTTFYEGIHELMSRRFCTSSFWCRCRGIDAFEFLTFYFIFCFSLALF